MKTGTMSHRWAVDAALAAVLVLVAAGVLAGGGDPELMSLLVLPVILIGAMVAYVTTQSHSPAYRWAVRVALGAGFILFWMIGAGGILGSDDHHPADLLYMGVLAVGIIGTILARFQPRGMARASFATALTQILIPVVALTAGMHRSPILSDLSGILWTLLLNGIFAALFVGSALLFRKAARDRAPGGEILSSAPPAT
jgi:hypothetical protein